MIAEIFEFCGCDVHKHQIEVAWLTLTGQKFLHGSFENTPEGNQQFWKECIRLGTTKVAMESTSIYWKAFYKSCPESISPTVFNSATIKLKTRPKTDTRDAMWIARCLRAGFISPSNIGLGKANEIRELCRLRNTIVEEITRKKNNIHKILDEYQRKLTTFSSSMNTHLALYTITILAQGGAFKDLVKSCPTTRIRKSIERNEGSLKAFLTPQLPPEAQIALDLALRGLLERAQACSKVDQELAKKLQDPTIHASLKILNSIPGISGVSALQLLFEIGRVDRFPSKRSIVSWAGLCPRIYSSGGKTSHGRITKRGNTHVRRILFQAARASLRVTNNPLKAWYQRLVARKPGRVALVALARKLLVIIYTLLNSGRTFESVPLGSEIKVYSTAKKIVRGLTTEPIAPLLNILVNWLDTPQEYRDSLSGIFYSMYEVVHDKRGTFS
ncbi:MAG: IS110 family transposase [Candidatus Heimdallarchaeota archaeon]|nr:IS110 family transposase [Candidatus Heimdallarchaeota archaeon]